MQDSNELKQFLYAYCLKHELLDQANLMVDDLASKNKLCEYEMMVDMFSRPFYIELKYKLAQQYKQHSQLLANSLAQLCPKQVAHGNLNGVKSLLMVLDLIK